MEGIRDCAGWLVDPPVLLHDVPLADAGDWDDTLAKLGYRKVPGAHEVATDYGVTFNVEAW